MSVSNINLSVNSSSVNITLYSLEVAFAAIYIASICLQTIDDCFFRIVKLNEGHVQHNDVVTALYGTPVEPLT